MRKFFMFVFVIIVLASVAGAVAAKSDNHCDDGGPGESCNDRPGNECENGEHVGNPHCPDPDDGDNENEDQDNTDNDDTGGDETPGDEQPGDLEPVETCVVDGQTIPAPVYGECPGELPGNETPGDEQPGDETPTGEQPPAGDQTPVTPGAPVFLSVSSEPQQNPISPEIEFWSHYGPAGAAIRDEFGTWHVIFNLDGQMVVFTRENGKIELRQDRFNPVSNAVEIDTTLSRLVGVEDKNPQHYRTFDLGIYLATGQLVFTNVYSSLNDEWCNQYNVCGTSYNWTNGELMVGGQRAN